MENYCMGIPKYHAESAEEAYSDDSSVHPEYPSYEDDAQYFDIDISMPFFPADTTPFSTSHDDNGPEEEGYNSDDSSYEDDAHYFDIDISMPFFPQDTTPISICNVNPCNSPAGNLFYRGQLLPLQLPTPPLDDIDKDIAFLQSCNVPGVKIQFPKLLKTATKLKKSLLVFRKSAKPRMDLQSCCAQYAGTGTAMAQYAGTGTAMESAVPKQNRSFTVKLKVVEVPLVSLFTRGSSKVSKKDDNNHGFKKKSEDSYDGEGRRKNMDREKKRAKEMVQKCIKKIKPFYVKISQRSNEKNRSGDLEKPRIRNRVKNGNCSDSKRQISFSYLSGNLKMGYKNLGKEKQPPSEIQQKLPNFSRSESTLMEAQTSIQGAIAHCKQSNYIH